jgi:predicted nucleotidyltransferase
MLDKDQIEKIVKYAERHPHISAIYLFGSRASGHERSRSDIDLGVLFVGDMDGFKRIDMETRLSNILKKDVDLVDLSHIRAGKNPRPTEKAFRYLYPIMLYRRRRPMISRI